MSNKQNEFLPILDFDLGLFEAFETNIQDPYIFHVFKIKKDTNVFSTVSNLIYIYLSLICVGKQESNSHAQHKTARS